MLTDGWTSEEAIKERMNKLITAFNKLETDVRDSAPVQKATESDYESDHENFGVHHDTNKKRFFRPPLQVQRNQFARDELLRCVKNGVEIKKLAVLGCGQLSFERFLALHFHKTGIESVVSIDLDAAELLHGIRYLDTYLFVNRNVVGGTFANPVHLEMLKGNILESDERLCNVDAVVCLEVVEHMPKEKATELMKCILTKICPKIAIVSTPNHDYNKVFRMDGKFRHHDHHFEMSAKEFEDWINECTPQAHYTHEIDFVGRIADNEVHDGDWPTNEVAPHEPIDEGLGGATQFAIFERKEDAPKVEEQSEFVAAGRHFKKLGDTVISYGLLSLIRLLSHQAMIDYLNTGKLSQCETRKLSQIYYIVSLADIISGLSEDRKSIILRDEEHACHSISTGSHGYISSAYEEVAGVTQWAVVVPSQVPLKELITYLHDCDY